MKNYIGSLVRKVVIEEIDEQLKKSSAEKLSPEDFANKVASAVSEKIPVFEVNRYRDFDDPHDSYSTEKMIKFSCVTEEWLWKKQNADLGNE